jgi:hypothetical protein
MVGTTPTRRPAACSATTMRRISLALVITRGDRVGVDGGDDVG